MPKRIRASVFQTVTLTEDDLFTIAQGLGKAASLCKLRASILSEAGYDSAAEENLAAAKAYASLARAIALAGK